jgi:glycosyltransferase involved in cell wall biosynthesis
MAKISVIMPCYNHAKYLKDSIGSVLKQTFLDWELVFVDDGSEDDSYKTAKAICEGYSSVQLIRQANQGQSRARQVALGAASGKYVVLLDSDDFLEPDMLERCAHVLDSDRRIDVVVGDAWYTSEDIDDKITIAEQRKWPGWPGIIRQNYFGVPCALMFKREKAIEAGGPDAGVKNGAEDWDFWIRLVRIGCKFTPLRQPIVRYRIVSASHSTDYNRSLEAIIQMLDFARKPDSRIQGDEKKPITERQYSAYRNGQVMRAFTCNWLLGHDESKLQSSLSLLHKHYLQKRYCRDLMVGGAVQLGRSEQIEHPPVSIEERDDLIKNAFARNGMSQHTEFIIDIINRIQKEHLQTYSFVGRVIEKWYGFRTYLR